MALVRVVLSWDVALVWVGVGKGGGQAASLGVPVRAARRAAQCSC